MSINGALCSRSFFFDAVKREYLMRLYTITSPRTIDNATKLIKKT